MDNQNNVTGPVGSNDGYGESLDLVYRQQRGDISGVGMSYTSYTQPVTYYSTASIPERPVFVPIQEPPCFSHVREGDTWVVQCGNNPMCVLYVVRLAGAGVKLREYRWLLGKGTWYYGERLHWVALLKGTKR